MGDRANVRFVYDFPPDAVGDDRRDIFFYTHWSGSELPVTVASALDRGRDRWSDEAYLARIIFSEMVAASIESTTGYGIAPYEPDGQGRTVVVDAREMTADGKPFEEFIKAVTRGKYGDF